MSPAPSKPISSNPDIFETPRSLWAFEGQGPTCDHRQIQETWFLLQHHQTHRDYPGFHSSLGTLQVKRPCCMYVHLEYDTYVYIYIYMDSFLYKFSKEKAVSMPWSSNHPTLKLDIRRLQLAVAFSCQVTIQQNECLRNQDATKRDEFAFGHQITFRLCQCFFGWTSWKLDEWS